MANPKPIVKIDSAKIIAEIKASNDPELDKKIRQKEIADMEKSWAGADQELIKRLKEE